MMAWCFDHRWLLLAIAKLAISLCVFIVGLFVARNWWPKFGVKSLVVYYIGRCIILWILIEIVHMVPPDIASWGEKDIMPILSGDYTVLNLPTVYYCGFIGMGVLLCKLFHSLFGLVLMFALAEFVAMLFLFAILRRVYDRAVATKTLILYITSPFGVLVSFLGAQDEPLIMLSMFSLLYFALVKQNLLGRILSIVFGIFFSKILILFYLFPMVLQKRFKGIFALVGLFLLYFLFRFFGGENILKIEGLSHVVTLGNIWYLLSFVPTWFQFLTFALASSLILLSLAPNFIQEKPLLRERLNAVMVLSVCLHFVLVLCHHMCFSPYLLPAIPFLIVMIIGNRGISLSRHGAFVLWMFAAIFCDSILYGMGPFCRSWILNVLSLSFIIINLTILVCVFKMYRNLFYSPVSAIRQILAYVIYSNINRENTNEDAT